MITLYGKMDFAKYDKVKDLELGRLLGLSIWALNVTTSVLILGQQREI